MEIPDEIKYIFGNSGKVNSHALRLMDMVQLFITTIGI